MAKKFLEDFKEICVPKILKKFRGDNLKKILLHEKFF